VLGRLDVGLTEVGAGVLDAFREVAHQVARAAPQVEDPEAGSVSDILIDHETANSR
jgi:hypothetical protein